MNNGTSQSDPRPGTSASTDQRRWPRQMTGYEKRFNRKPQHDFVKHAIEYSREHPGVAAFCCLGVGFILGWKLKPW